MPWRGWNRSSHYIKEDTISVEGNGGRRPVEAVFVEFGRRVKRELVDLKCAGTGGIIAGEFGLRGLQNEVDGVRGAVELAGEELEIDLLGVIEVLRMCNITRQ